MPPEAPRIATRLFLGVLSGSSGGNQSKQEKAVKVTSGIEEACSWVRLVGFFAAGSDVGFTWIYSLNVAWPN